MVNKLTIRRLCLVDAPLRPQARVHACGAAVRSAMVVISLDRVVLLTAVDGVPRSSARRWFAKAVEPQPLQAIDHAAHTGQYINCHSKEKPRFEQYGSRLASFRVLCARSTCTRGLRRVRFDYVRTPSPCLSGLVRLTWLVGLSWQTTYMGSRLW